MTAGFQKLFHVNPSIGFLAQARQYQAALDEGKVIGAAANLGQMAQIARNNYVNAVICGIFILVVIVVFIAAIRMWVRILAGRSFTLHEAPYRARDSNPKEAAKSRV
jgi:carbon starvation protein